MQLNYTKHKDTSRGITFGLHFLVQMLPKNPKTHPKSLLHVPHSEVLALPGSSVPQASNRTQLLLESHLQPGAMPMGGSCIGSLGEGVLCPSVCLSVCLLHARSHTCF